MRLGLLSIDRGQADHHRKTNKLLQTNPRTANHRAVARDCSGPKEQEQEYGEETVH